MNAEDRIVQYKKALTYYKKHPDGRLVANDPNEFYGLCDVFRLIDPVLRDETELTEFQTLEPRSCKLFWWATTRTGVKTRIKKLNHE